MMFESPNTQPPMRHQNHLRVQERPATITSKASAQRLNSQKQKTTNQNVHTQTQHTQTHTCTFIIPVQKNKSS